MCGTNKNTNTLESAFVHGIYNINYTLIRLQALREVGSLVSSCRTDRYKEPAVLQ